MSFTGLDTFDKTIQKTNIWLRELSEELRWDNKENVYRALRAVLHTIRDFLTINEAADFGAQLPLLIRGVYYDDFTPSKLPYQNRKLIDFVTLVKDRFAIQEPMKESLDIGAMEDMIKKVFRVISMHVTPGEMSDVVHMLPKEIARFLSESEKRQ